MFLAGLEPLARSQRPHGCKVTVELQPWACWTHTPKTYLVLGPPLPGSPCSRASPSDWSTLPASGAWGAPPTSLPLAWLLAAAAAREEVGDSELSVLRTGCSSRTWDDRMSLHCMCLFIKMPPAGRVPPGVYLRLFICYCFYFLVEKVTSSLLEDVWNAGFVPWPPLLTWGL